MSSLSIPSFLSYSNEFKLITCSYCLRAIDPSIISSYTKKHLEDEGVSKEEQALILASLIRLEVLPIKESYNKIVSFTSIKPLLPIPFLPILNELFKCSSCFTIKLSKQSILRHISIDHPSFKDKENRYKIVLGQCLRINHFYFPIENKDKGREEGEASFNTQLDSATTSLLDSYFKQEESIKEQATIFTLNLEVDKLTPFQLKTKYYQFLLNKDLKHLSVIPNWMYSVSGSLTFYLFASSMLAHRLLYRVTASESTCMPKTVTYRLYCRQYNRPTCTLRIRTLMGGRLYVALDVDTLILHVNMDTSSSQDILTPSLLASLEPLHYNAEYSVLICKAC